MSWWDVGLRIRRSSGTTRSRCIALRPAGTVHFGSRQAAGGRRQWLRRVRAAPAERCDGPGRTDERWALSRARVPIADHLGVSLSIRGVGELLRRHGWSCRRSPRGGPSNGTRRRWPDLSGTG
ncbi:winged helix-turn-helix domain-containing protein [Streptomyces sp. NPDC058751]|uniref:winged helix-turn-helix domain-containing protein n=1 Tax=Streptomyces sp. NPDC058751 TaxID=3346623 RepID=UPI00369D246D